MILPIVFSSYLMGLPSSVINNLTIPELPILNGNTIRNVYHYEQIVVIMDRDDGLLKHCTFIEVYEPSDQIEMMDILSALSIIVRNVTMEEILFYIDDCNDIERITSDENRENQSTITTALYNSALHGIAPNTKWCGTGSIASGYNDLGPSPDIDKCCRAHDFCPIKIRANREAYNLKNQGYTTKSHCQCELAFYECLLRHQDTSSLARFIGNLYFNVFRPLCIDGLPENISETMKFIATPKSWSILKDMWYYIGWNSAFT